MAPSIDDEKMVERVARVIYVAEYPDSDPDEIIPLGSLAIGEEVSKGPSWSLCETHARDAIAAHKSALSDAGYVIVPREPTDAMIAIGQGWCGEYPAEDVWREMIKAAPK
jgi:hypothetical protein